MLQKMESILTELLRLVDSMSLKHPQYLKGIDLVVFRKRATIYDAAKKSECTCNFYPNAIKMKA